MNYIYLAYHFHVEPKYPGTEILIAELGEKPFESFEETDSGVIAYIQKKHWTPDVLEGIQIVQSDEFAITYRYEEIEQVNWNEEWEKNFTPIDVDGVCYVRAPFHEQKQVPYEIVIEPKMSFGTGHHETTYMMIQQLLQNNTKEKVVLDMGCGTAILAILAAMQGAREVDAIDIDNWCYLNSIENAGRNGCSSIKVYEGGTKLLPAVPKYDVILANINRNILLKDMEAYVKCLNEGGQLFFSGFYVEDIPVIQSAGEQLGLTYVSRMEKNNWVSLKMIKN